MKNQFVYRGQLFVRESTLNEAMLYDIVNMRGEAAGVRYRPHDMRHTFISRFAENPNVSRQMLERYIHIRSQAKQAAIRAFGQPSIEPILQVTAEKWAQRSERGHARPS